jgi:hypothetical protein
MAQISKGVELRAQIDAEQIKALLLINGGGAIALLTILPKVFDIPALNFMIKPILIGLLALTMGLVFAVISNQFRRYCSHHFELHDMQPPKGKFLGITLWAPTICVIGQCFMWLSVVAFFSAGMFLAISGLNPPV